MPYRSDARRWVLAALGGTLMATVAAAAGPAPADPPGRVTGVGGLFVRSADPHALMAWYRDVLGLRLEPWGGAILRADAPSHPPVLVLNALPQANGYMAPSTREFMLDLAVDDLDAVLARVRAKGVAVLGQDDRDAHGRFAWLLDPNGTKIELWQPAAPRR